MGVGGTCSSPAERHAAETWMFREAAEAPAVVQRQRERNAPAMRELGARLRAMAPRAVVTLARGSSDHAATFARYAIEQRMRVLTSSLSPSIASIYDSTPDLAGMAVLAISQSGRSPDLLSAAEQARATGAVLIAMVNDEDAPLAELADVTIPLGAGPERSVAASKTFIASLAAVLDLLGAWSGDPSVDSALSALPDKLEQAWELDWSDAIEALADASNMYVVGRGPGLAIAQEAALKLKETCGLHAEGISGAEIRHGPMALLRPRFPVLLFAQSDQSRESLVELASNLAERGASMMSAGIYGAPGIQLPVVAADPLIAPLLQIASFYRLANALALARGLDPDRPPHLAKVTETR
jgi:glucosamine--fructose-6-phosphate aminotransferase (isomerizing)